MPHFLLKPEPQPAKQILELEQEIARLEHELATAETNLNVFTAQIRAQLLPQIKRIQELSVVYKKLKADKKAKRLAQKKKGKNYREPQELRKTINDKNASKLPAPENQQELKRLYKEAVRQVHPDKFANEETGLRQRATEITMQLNEFYESGDLEELKGFYEYIISGNAMSHVPYKPETVTDPAALLNYLRRKLAELTKALQDIKTSELYHVLTTYEQPLAFIPELRLQFEQKIAQLEKRTRKARLS